ncbi:MAG TPA: hypothetical protein VHQ43_10755 [Solirubrobacterales bacterium]|nr:hypothetical protein [Solirubrobacterales bacterium]
MARSRAEQLAWEERWALPVSLCTLAALLTFIAAFVVGERIGGGDGEAELLRNVDAHATARIVASVLQGIAIGLLAAPLAYLFQAAAARSERVRGRLIGVVIAAPLFLTVAAVLTGVSTVHAAQDFVTSEVPRLLAKGVALGSERADDAASDTLSSDSLRPLAAGFALAGQLGFIVAMFYTALWAMRTGLLTRFWGSLGLALGAVSFFPVLFQFAVLWFVYLGLLIVGRVPGGRPPAWAAGEAIPWPTPGERAAAELGGGDEAEQANPPPDR